jgi:DNA-directed RNA polymerase subunit omega
MTARYTSEDATNMIGNRYDLVLIASIRARELKRGHRPKIISEDGAIVTALNEIEQGHIGIEYLQKVKKPGK